MGGGGVERVRLRRFRRLAYVRQTCSGEGPGGYAWIGARLWRFRYFLEQIRVAIVFFWSSCWRLQYKGKPCNVGPKSYLRNVAQRGTYVSL